MDASRQPLDSTLADLLHALRHRGVTVGPDDAARVATVFRYAEDWSRERRIRALKAILGRTEEDRQIIQRLSPFLFVNAPGTTEAWEPAATLQEKPPEPIQSRPRDQASPSATVRSDAQPPPAKKSFRAILLAVLLLCCVVLAISYHLPAPDPDSLPDTNTQPMDSSSNKPSSPAPETLWRTGADVSASGESCDVLPVEQWPTWALAGVALSLLVYGLLIWRRSQRFHAQEKHVKRLADSEGPRVFQPSPPDHMLIPWIDATLLREAAFLLNAPSEPTQGRWMDVERSVAETARQGGRPVLVHHGWLQQRPICFIEDVSPAMAPWPSLGAQIVEALERQGGVVHHWRMRGTPVSLSREEEPWSPLALEQALAATPDCTVILFGNVAPLDVPGWRGDLSWLGNLTGAVWLHPGEKALWKRGAQRLSTALRMIPVSEGEMDRMVGSMAAESSAAATWRAPESRGGDGEGRIALLRVMMGDAVIHWLVAGVVLDSVHLLTLRTWRGMGGLPFIGVSKSEAERALALPEVFLLPHGGVTLASELKNALLRKAKTDTPELLSHIVRWILDWVDREAERQPAGSLARVEALITRARLLALDPSRKKEARRLMNALARDGVGSWLEVGVGSEERSGWPAVSLSAAKKVSGGGWLTAALAAMLAPGIGWLAMEWPWVASQTQILEQRLQFLGPEPARYLAPDAPLRFCDRRQLADRIKVSYQGNSVELPGEKDLHGAVVWTLPWDSPVFAGVEKPSRLALDIGYNKDSMDAVKEVVLLDDVRQHLSSLLQGWLRTPNKTLENPIRFPILGDQDILSLRLLAKGEVLKFVDMDQGMVEGIPLDTLLQADELRLAAGDRVFVSLIPDCWRMAEAVGKGECSVDLGGEKMAFVYLPGGTFKMGSPPSEKNREEDEGPVHEVRLNAFWLGKYEVTNSQYRKFKRDHDSGDYEGNDLNGNDQPVVMVRWQDAEAYGTWLSGRDHCMYRLPTEAEWEYAARGGTNFIRYWGNGEKEACQHANVADRTAQGEFPDWQVFDCKDGYAVAAPTGQFKPNGFGLYDMMGNVWEWTADWYDSKYYAESPQDNPQGPSGGSDRVYRGGSWGRYPASVRSALRSNWRPAYRDGNLGFRLARTCP